MSTFRRILPAVFLIACATAAAEPVVPVEVRFNEPEKFRDLRSSRVASERESLALAGELRRHLEQRAPRHLPPGTRLAVTITDVDMAGEHWPIAGLPVNSDVRVVKDVFPPRIDLDFRLSRSDGSVVREGHRELRDAMFLSSVSPSSNDLLRFEKALLDAWLQREFAAPR